MEKPNQQHSLNRVYLPILFILVLLVAPFFSLHAATFKADETLLLPPGSVIDDDMYAAGGQVTIESDVEHDALVAGNTVSVPGEIRQDLFVAGSDVSVTGVIGDDVRAAGAKVVFDGLVGDDVAVLGADIQILSDAHFGGGIYALGNRVILNGVVEGETRISADIIEINGRLEGPVLLHAANIVIGNKAVILDSLEYTSVKKATISSGATIDGEVKYIEEKNAAPAGLQGVLVLLIGGLFLIKFLSFLLMSLLVLYFYPHHGAKPRPVHHTMILPHYH